MKFKQMKRTTYVLCRSCFEALTLWWIKISTLSNSLCSHRVFILPNAVEMSYVQAMSYALCWLWSISFLNQFVRMSNMWQLQWYSDIHQLCLTLNGNIWRKNPTFSETNRSKKYPEHTFIFFIQCTTHHAISNN